MVVAGQLRMGLGLYSTIWNKFCGLQERFEETPQALCKMVQELSQKILDLHS